MNPASSRSLAASITLLSACSSFSSDGPSRSDVITALVEDVMVPAHDELAATTAALAGSAEFCGAGATAGLAAAQTAWRHAHQAMGRTEAFGFGPATDDHHDAALLFWPTRPELVEAIVMDTAAIDASTVAALGAAAKGLPAIEAQLFDPVGGDAAVLARFADETTGARRCTLVALLAADAAAHGEALRGAWAPDGGDFGGELVNAGTGVGRYAKVQAALDEVLNGAIAMLQVIDDLELAVPLGSKTGGVPVPEQVPSPWADDSIAMTRAQLAAVGALWHGAGRPGLRQLVRARSPLLVPDVDAAILAADAALGAITGPLRVAVVDDAPVVQTAIDRVKDVRRLFTVDVAQQLDGTVTLSDNDGD